MGWILACFYSPGVGNMEFTHQKYFPGVLPEGGWSGLELTDTLPTCFKAEIFSEY